MAARGRPKKVIEAAPMNDVVTRLARMEEKIEHIHRCTEENTTEIKALRHQVAMGRGGIKVIIWLGAILGGVVAIYEGLIK
jgi:tetrahydromethanopterin S-methyltransferase subunit G|tara:strand:+ start:412 stop:654 length:243 start_codon:yes stop_codon:yes gene_type:complete